MRHEAEFERWLADWIETGPYEAPDRAADHAIAFAQTHRQRRLTRSAVWRSVMDRLHLTPVVAPSARNGWLMAAAVVVVVVLVAAAVVGSGTIRFGGSDERLPVVGGSITPAPPTPAPSPVAVTNRASCTLANGGSGITVLGIDHQWGMEIDCLVSASDPRVGGANKVIVAMDGRADQSANMWGTDVITNKDGTWEGRFWGTIDKGSGTHRIETLYTGAGAYAGLEYRTHVTSEDAGMNTSGTGVIRPVGPEISGTETCAQTDAGVTEPVDNMTVTREAVMSCTDSMSDPRVSGTSTVQYSLDVSSDQSAAVWGSLVLTNNAGTWEGRWSGTIDKGYTTHRFEAVLTGTGAYAGLEYHFKLLSDNATITSTLSGTIEPAN